MLSGLSCGLAVSNHLLTVTISAGVFALVLWSGSFRKSLKGVIVFSLCFLVGALPYILAIWLIPGAYKNLPGSVSFVDTLSRLIFPALSQTLPGAMGVNPILFPDLVGHVDWPSALRSIFAIFYSLLLLSLIVQRAKVFFTSVIRKTWPQLDLVDLAIITSRLTLWVFASHHDTYQCLSICASGCMVLPVSHWPCLQLLYWSIPVICWCSSCMPGTVQYCCNHTGHGEVE